MRSFIPRKLNTYRTQTFRLHLSGKIKNPAQALDFVNERGFVYFWPIKNVDLPSLWVAVAGDRPVADAHDDPGHITWRWKDQALGKKTWYYAKVLRRKATLISLAMAPYFYALSENFGSPEEDHLVAYKEGRLTLAAKQVYEALLEQGAMNTIDLRRAARLTSKSSDTEFNRALEVLQADFKSFQSVWRRPEHGDMPLFMTLCPAIYLNWSKTLVRSVKRKPAANSPCGSSARLVQPRNAISTGYLGGLQNC